MSDRTTVSDTDKESVSDADTFVGQLLAERYKIQAVLGTGGMGRVYAAHDVMLSETVAIKLLKVESTSIIERFKLEARNGRKVTHPNVVRIFDIGTAEGHLFLSMEHVAGGTLRERVRRSKGLPVREGVRVIAAVCDGLAAVHDAGVVHRDIKPGNVLFDEDDTPKLADFGIARLDTTPSVTKGFLGTPTYASPEQANLRPATAASDIYSLGVMMYEIFAGRPPFRSPDPLEVLEKHRLAPPPPLARARPDLPDEVYDVIERALAKDPQARPTSAREIAATLRREPQNNEIPAAPPPRGNRRWVNIALSLGVLGILAAALWVVGTREAPAPQPEAAPSAQAAPPPAAEVVEPPKPSPQKPAGTRARRPRRSAAAPTARSKPATEPKQPAHERVGITVNAQPWVAVWIDGRQVATETPLRDFEVKAGRHSFRFVNPTTGFKLAMPIDVPAGKRTSIFVNAATGEVEIN